MGTRLKTEEIQVTPPLAPPSVWPRASLPEYGPRVVRLTKASRFGIGFLGTVAAAAVLIGGLIIADRAKDGSVLAREGQVAAARAIKEPIEKGEGKKYPISYRFDYQGRTYSDRQRVRRSFYEGLRDVDTVEVTFLPRDPNVHKLGRVTNADVEKDMANGILIVVLVSGLFGGLAWAIRAAAQRESRILSDWTATSAQILESKKSYGSEHGTTYKLKIRYRVPRQADVEATTKFTRQGKLDLPVGSFVDVLYDPEDVTRVRIREGLTAAEVDPSTY